MNQSSTVRLIKGSSANASSLASDLVGQVALVVTSPPYHNAISYKTHSRDSKANYRTRSDLNYGTQYMPFLNSVWGASIEMLKPGGIMAINVGSVLEDGYHYPLAEDIIGEILEKFEIHFLRSIFWHKVTAGVKRAGSVIQHPYPGYWHPNIMTEHVMLFNKPGANFQLNTDYPKEWNNPVWDLAPVPPRTINHPAPYPEDLPHRFIRMFTKKEDWVLDPFNGAGTTTKAAIDLGRNGLGFDIESKYLSISKKRLEAPTSVRQSQLQINPVSVKDFVPKASKGRTRQGSGLKSVSRG
jgi:site-specific DNA-methyltransferase (adenine-specific)